TLEERRRFTVAEDEWVQMNTGSRQLKERALEILADWGGFLDVNLYREALVHFLGGPASVSRSVEIFSGSRRVGVQTINVLNEEIAFALTTKHDGVGAMRDHLNRLLEHTRLKAIQWLNFNRHRIEFTTLT